MAKSLEEIPLFPVNAVLFPYAMLQLHIFEPRYRSMILDCVEFERPFGIVLIRSGEEVAGPAEPYLVGTACRITDVVKLPDGRMDIQVQGERRFRIREIDDSGEVMVGKVEPVIESVSTESGDLNDLTDRLRHIFKELVQASIARNGFSVNVTFPNDPVVLSFTMASLLSIGNLEKQRMLETTDTGQRVEELLPILEQQLLETSMTEPQVISGAIRMRASQFDEVACLN